MSFLSCRKESELDQLAQTQWAPEIAVPLINSNLSVEEILITNSSSTNFLEIDSTQFITLVYATELYSIHGQDFLNLPDIYTLITDTLQTVGFPVIEGHQLRYVDLSQGNFFYNIPSVAGSSDVAIEISSPDISKNGSSLQENLIVPSSQGTTQYVSGNIDLGGYRLDLSGGGTTTNGIRIYYNATNLESLADITASIPFNAGFNDLLFNYADGQFEQYNFQQHSDTLYLDIFRNWLAGTLYLENPKLKLVVSNSYGIPITAELGTLEAWSEVNGGTLIPVSTTTSLTDTFVLNYPTIGQIGNSITTGYELDGDNSNILNVIAISPQELRVNMLFNTIAGLNSSEINFITDESEFSVDLEMQLPMSGRIEGMVLSDTFQLAAPTEELFNGLQEAKFKLKTFNKLPFDISMQLYFHDSDFNLLDSMLIGDKKILTAGIIDSNGRVVNAKEKSTYVSFDNARAKAITNSKFLRLKVWLNTNESGAQTIRLYSDYYLGIRLGVQAKTQLN